MSTKKFIKTAQEIQQAAFDNYIKNINQRLEIITQKQEYIYNTIMYSINAITAIRRVLEKNGYVSIADVENEILELTNEQEILKETLANQYGLDLINGEDMIQA